MKKKLPILLVLAVLASIVVYGTFFRTTRNKDTLGNNNTTAAPSIVKTDLIIATATEAVTLDPQGGWDGASLYILRQMYNGLVKLDHDMKIVGDLAESWEFTSATSVTFYLRRGVKFHNGDEMKASDVVFSIQRAQKSAKVKAFVENIESVAAVGDYSVTIQTTVPYAPLMSNLCHTACSIVNQKAAEGASDNFSLTPVGTGPFAFVQWDSGSKIVLTRNKDYFGGEVLPSSLTFRLMTEGTARTMALETGEVDLNLVVAPSDAKRVETDNKMRLVVSMSPKIEYVSMNQKVSPFNNPLVRQAINYAINRKTLNAVATAGYGVVTDSVMNSQIVGYTDDVAHYEYNPEKARELLVQAGYPNGFSTRIVVYGDIRNLEAQLIQGNLKDVGINLEIITMESTTLLEQINNGDYEMFIMSYNNTTGDPDTSLYMLFHSQVPASSGNRSYTHIPRVDMLLDHARLEMDATTRMAKYKEIQQVLKEIAVWVPLHCLPNLVGIRRGLEGFTPHPLGNDVFDQLHYI